MNKKNNISEIADLACLKFDKLEQDTFQDSFEQILTFFEILNEAEVNGVQPMITPHEVITTLRQDIINPDISVDNLMELAPDSKDSLYKVPPVV